MGYMGDGINDAITLHSADAGIFVDTAAETAKDAGNLVLHEKDLRILAEGICE